MKLILNESSLKTMHDHAQADYPNECCGFFYGDTGDRRKVQEVQPVKNAKEGDQRQRFHIDPKDYQKAEKYALDHDLDLLGVYHSHPNHPAEPSEHDRKVAMPWFSYIIISVRDGKGEITRSWRLNEQRQFEEEIIEQTEVHRT
ncbi:Proteasome lid subunit RPN8/RPN11, contains Jab1/MPN metalloenzyme (JAMM) motif [Fodinibius salinus]|uniref:Proteasome lid subunit RPN8/RPN11, contains Jab1/MPN metalloenzyme (JAMM) motif n=1 Tax=Fodinibius salinus TaxID=860790 RepID=A0A5D3YJT0_9BACT|nr:M67 family metallopeptidase [Fodinibius salinus]TYP93768.1 Proteasome lid subunit RPN8/RPN11, contains Jab1/MPN metalloenzyme (JAMM) motif [Fodinibius salinus]